MLTDALAGLLLLALAALGLLAARYRQVAGHLRFAHRVLDQLPIGLSALTHDGHALVNLEVRRRHGLPLDVRFTAADVHRMVAEREGAVRRLHADDTPEEVAPMRAALAGRDVDQELVIDAPAESEAGAGGAPADLPQAPRQHVVKVMGRPLLDEAGRLVGGLTATYDLTGLHEAHAALLRRDRDTAAIAAAVRAVLTGREGPHAIVTAAQAVVGSAVATLFQPDGHGDLVATASTCEAFVGHRASAAGGSLTADCFQTGAPSWVDDSPSDPRIDQRMVAAVEHFQGVRLGAGVWYPISTGGRCLGVLVIGCAAGTRPPRDAEPMLELLATETALALAHEDLLRELERVSAADPLTGVANRRAWELALDQELPRALRDGTPLSLLMIDLDHFKEYNDRFGHAAGDRLLVAATQAWLERLRPGDLLCRWGGEEFAVLLPNCSLDGACAVAEDLRRRMPAGTTCSIGVALWDGEESMGDLVARADARLYAAKATGRDRVRAADVPSRRGGPAAGRAAGLQTGPVPADRWD